MARKIIWRSITIGDITDHYGQIDKITMFTLSQMTGEHMWILTSHFIPSSKRGSKFHDVEQGKRSAQEIVDRFANWLSERTPRRCGAEDGDPAVPAS